MHWLLGLVCSILLFGSFRHDTLPHHMEHDRDRAIRESLQLVILGQFMVSPDEYLMLQLWEVWAWFFSWGCLQRRCPGALEEEEEEVDEEEEDEGGRGTRRRRRRRGRLEAAAPPPQSSPSLPVERRISRSCTNPQKSSKPKNPSCTFSSIPPPPCWWTPTPPASPTTGQYNHIKPWTKSRTKSKWYIWNTSSRSCNFT